MGLASVSKLSQAQVVQHLQKKGRVQHFINSGKTPWLHGGGAEQQRHLQ